MSLQVLGPRAYFWQWDSGQRLLVTDTDCGEVHFCNGTGDCALVVSIQRAEDGSRFVNVPNILLQTAKPIQAYLFQRHADGAETRTKYSFQVLARSKPDDYVYDETEVWNYKALEARMQAMEDNLDEQVASSIEKYLEDNPPSGGVDFETDDTLTLKGGILSVNTTDQMEQDNTLPITSAGVYATVGNIEALLKTI